MGEEDTWGEFIKGLFYYHTVKVVQIRSKKLAAFYYGVVFLVLVYVVGYAIIYQKGYQGTGSLIGNTAVKVKGSAYLPQTDGPPVIWDAQDEPDALFITTNFLATRNQSRGICAGKDVATESCPCTANHPTVNGIETGECSTSDPRFCDLYAWCQLEDDEDPTNFLVGLKNFSIFIRSTVKWPRYQITRNNVMGDYSQPKNGYNQFFLSQMVPNFEAVQAKGGAIAVIINWDCNFDRNEDECQPDITFTRIDDPNQDTFSSGYNFRYAHYYYLTNSSGTPVEFRDLYKVFGIRFIFLVTGIGRKFDIVPLVLNIGAGLALLTVATLISDFFTLCVLPDRKFYAKVKYEEVEDKGLSAFLAEKELEETDDESNALLDSMSFH